MPTIYSIYEKTRSCVDGELVLSQEEVTILFDYLNKRLLLSTVDLDAENYNH